MSAALKWITTKETCPWIKRKQIKNTLWKTKCSLPLLNRFFFQCFAKFVCYLCFLVEEIIASLFTFKNQKCFFPLFVSWSCSVTDEWGWIQGLDKIMCPNNKAKWQKTLIFILETLFPQKLTTKPFYKASIHEKAANSKTLIIDTNTKTQKMVSILKTWIVGAPRWTLKG